MKNKLIIFEGIDGVGKSTLSVELKKKLVHLGVKTIFYEEYEKKIKNFNSLKPFIKSTVAKSSIDSSLLFYLSSALYKSVVIRKLLKKSWVICDRYIYSTMAYHQTRGASKKIISSIYDFGILKPDFVFLITVDESIRKHRVRNKGLIEKDDLIPKKIGNIVYNTEKYLKALKLKEISNNESLDKTVASILEIITKK